MTAEALQLRFRLRRRDFTLDVDLRLPGRGITALFGPSGAGKTTCLRCVAGLERPEEARLVVHGDTWQDSARGLFLPVHRRALGYVFQEDALFPHLSVQGNLEYGLRRTPRAQRRIAWEQAVELLGIAPLLSRVPATLSGGERQRVSIARALLASPRLLLMDEPLASLDAARKQDILPWLARLHDELDMPVLYVSHSPDEVARLAGHVVLFDGGRLRAQGTTADMLALVASKSLP